MIASVLVAAFTILLATAHQPTPCSTIFSNALQALPSAFNAEYHELEQMLFAGRSDDAFSTLLQCVDNEAPLVACQKLDTHQRTAMAAFTKKAELRCFASKGSSTEVSLSFSPDGWRYLGPFLYGKTEFDGDPLASAVHGGVHNTTLEHPVPVETQKWVIKEVLLASCGLLLDAARCKPLKDAFMTTSTFHGGTVSKPGTKATRRTKGPFEYHSEVVSNGKIPIKDVWKKLPQSSLGRGGSVTLNNDHVAEFKGVPVLSRGAVLSATHQELQGLIQEVGMMAVMEFVGFAFSDMSITLPSEATVATIQMTVAARSVHSVFYTVVSNSINPKDVGGVYGVAGDQYGRLGGPLGSTFTTLKRTKQDRTQPHIIMFRFFSRFRGVVQAQQEVRFTSIKVLVSRDPSLGATIPPASSFALDARAPQFLPNIVRGTFFGVLNPDATNRVVHGSWVAIPTYFQALMHLPVYAGDFSFEVRGKHADLFCMGFSACGLDASDVMSVNPDPNTSRDYDYAQYKESLLRSHRYLHTQGDVVMADQLLPVRVWLAVRGGKEEAVQQLCSKSAGGTVVLSVGIAANVFVAGGSAESIATVKDSFTMKLGCRNFDSQSFVVTFLDRDGSVAEGAVRAPLVTSTTAKATTTFPTVLSLHGTGVTASSQVDSYKRGVTKADKSNGYPIEGDYVFGVDGAWVIAPDRHGAHNWESIGKFSALSLLFHVASTSSSATAFNGWVASAQQVLSVGHSMGGHGALHIAAHHPDRFMGVVVLAAWISKEHYGDANRIFQLDTSTAFVDGARRGELEASVSDNNPDLLLSNLLDIPIAIRVGANDKTVSPFYSRRLWRLLRLKGHQDVVYSEVPAKEHWWWDTNNPNDGGCMNDPTLRKLFKRLLANGDHVHNRQMEQATFTTLNPAAVHSKHSIRVARQHRQLRPTTFTAQHVSKEELALSRVANIASLKIPAEVKKVTVDGVVVAIQADGFLCFNDDSKVTACAAWMVMPNTPPSPRHYTEKTFAIAVKSNCHDVRKWFSSACQATHHHALFVANLNFVAYDTVAPFVISGSEAASRYAQTTVQLDISEQHNLYEGTIRLVGHTLYLAGGSRQAVDHLVVDIGLPTVPPMMRAPFGNLLPLRMDVDIRRRGEGYGEATLIALDANEHRDEHVVEREPVGEEDEL